MLMEWLLVMPKLPISGIRLSFHLMLAGRATIWTLLSVLELERLRC